MKTRLFSLAAIVLLLFAPLPALASFSFSQGGDGTVFAILATVPCPYGAIPDAASTPTVAINSNEIDISSPGGGIRSVPVDGYLCDPQVAPPITLKATLGKLADGTYKVVWNFFSPTPLQATASFAIVSGSLKSIFPSAVTGFWYDPAFSGSGFNIQMSWVGLVATYYGWDATGNRLWLTSDFGPTSLIPNTPITLNMSYTTGGTFNNPQHNVTQWGTLVLNFSDCRDAAATLSGKDGTLKLNLIQLVGANDLPGC